MPHQSSYHFVRPHIDVRALLGIYDPPDSTDWGPIRAAQLTAGKNMALVMLGANMVGTALMAMLIAPSAPSWQVTAWIALVSALGLIIARHRISVHNRLAGSAKLRDVQATTIDGVAMGIAWAIPPLFFGPRLEHDAALGMWLILSLLMTAASVATAALPLATILFIAITGTAMVVSLITSPVFALAGLLMVLLLIVGTLDRGRALVVLRANEIAIHERDETVSLLLRESESKDADWLWETDAQRRVIRANPQFALSLGVDPSAIDRMSFLQVLAGPSWETGKFHRSLHELAERMKVHEPFHKILVPVEVGGEERWWQISAAPRFDDSGLFCGFRGVGSDITEARRSADQINRMARFDSLTGLPNRRLVYEALSHAIRQAEQWGSRCAFMLIDLDRFKVVNDTLGHPTGDRLLGLAAERLKTLVTENDMIGRLGGDEFAIVVRDAADSVRLEQLAQTVIDTITGGYEVDSHMLYIGCSIGLATGPRDGQTAETLIRSADLALYKAKGAGGGVFRSYEPQLHAIAEERRLLEIALRNAVDNGDFTLHYQPVVNLHNGGLIGFESLLRWSHPQLGEIPPERFIGLAEEARLISRIGEWVIRAACMEAAQWAHPLRISVNVSADQLHNNSFLTAVKEALAASGLEADRLEIEVTESVFLREDTSALNVLENILDLGVRLSLDDFGKGYSSLGYLAHTRFSSIKIDRSFVQNASTGGKEAIAIIRAVVALADSLGMETTAEGVETAVELDLVHDLGCTNVQGFYYGRPLPSEEARQIILHQVDALRQSA